MAEEKVQYLCGDWKGENGDQSQELKWIDADGEHNFLDETCGWSVMEGVAPVLPAIPQSQEECAALSWDEINALACDAAKNPEQYRHMIGYTHNFTYEGEEYNARIVDVCHFELADGNGKAGLSFEFVELIPTTYQMNASQTIAGGYPEMDMYKTHLPSVRANMPSELTRHFITVKLPYNIYLANGKTGAEAYSTAETTADLYIHSATEIFDPASHQGVDGTLLQWYKGKARADRKKFVNKTGVAGHWWLRTPYNSGNNFKRTYTNGDESSANVTDQGINIAPGFSIGKSS